MTKDMICSVVKRNGEKEDFDQGKIEFAIECAFESNNIGEDMVEAVCDKVLKHILGSGTTLTSTESINDYVERSFMELGHYEEAKNFIIHRETTKNIKKMSSDGNAMSEYIFMNRYSRYLPYKHRRETWNEAIDRVRDMHIKKHPKAETDLV